MRGCAGMLHVAFCSGIRSSVVQLEAAAESLKFITNTSPGKILGESVCRTLSGLQLLLCWQSTRQPFLSGYLAPHMPQDNAPGNYGSGAAVFNGTHVCLPAGPAAVAARMCTFAETRCGGFEASAARGYLHAWLANIGTLPASYTIIVTDCR